MGISRFDTVLANAFIGPGMQANPFGVTFYVGNTTNPSENQGSAGTTRQGRSPKNPFATIAAAEAEAVAGRGDTIVIQRLSNADGGTPYVENVTFSKAGLSVIAGPPEGFSDHVVIRGTTVVTASGCSFYGIEFFSNDATAASLQIGTTTDVNSTWIRKCSFASDGTTEPRYGLRVLGGNNTHVYGCFFVDNTWGFSVHAGTVSYASGVYVVGNYFMENTTAHFGTGGQAGTLGVDQGIRNLQCHDNYFGRGDVTPTDYVSIVTGGGTSSGSMSGNRFALATNASADIVIPAGILYMANATEAGWSTARPA